jgi:hypothetical protein
MLCSVLLFASRVALAADATPTPDAAQPASPPSPAAPTEAAPAQPVQLPFWMTEDVLKAAVAINLTDPQKHDFNESVGEYVSEHFAMIQKEAKREAPDLERRVSSRDNSLLHQLDAKVKKILTNAQWPAYENYRKTLQKTLKTAPLPQQSGGTRAQPGVGGGRG